MVSLPDGRAGPRSVGWIKREEALARMVSALRTAAAALGRNRLRTALTTLSISIGIAAVMSTLALGAGSSAQVQRQIDDLGEDFIWIEAGSVNIGGLRSGYRGARTLTPDDAIAIEDAVVEITACSPQISGREQVVAGNMNWRTNYRGVAPSFFDIRRWPVRDGTRFTEYDLQHSTRVAVLGSVVAERLFGEEPAVGRSFRMGRFAFRVIGVLQPKGASRGSVDRDDSLFVPFTTARRNLNRQHWVDDIMCSAAAPDQMPAAEQQIVSLLRLRHDIPPDGEDDFEIRRPIESLELRANATRTMAQMLVAIGAVSLIVGGVGIMNIMLVSVAERTREIGVRLAIGARMRDIRRQFLIEAATLGVIGGLAGVAIGFVVATALADALQWPVVISRDGTLLALAIAVGSGIIFGYYPAHRASQLDPIEALRAEP
jgi:putative ABC transport system permease protein